MTREKALNLVSEERDRQTDQWGGGHDTMHTAHDWLALIMKHGGRAAFTDDTEAFKRQMVIVGALAVAALEQLKP